MHSIREKLEDKDTGLTCQRENHPTQPVFPEDHIETPFFLIDVSLITIDPDQPRKHFDEQSLSDLCESIRKTGVLQPVLIRKDADDKIWLVAGDPITVKIHFSAGQARYIRERTWAKGQKINEQKDGSIILTMKTSSWWDVRQWILSFGSDAELLEPAEKREEMKGSTQKTASLYVK